MSYDADSDGLLSEVNPRTSACLRISGTAYADLEDGVGVLDPSWMITIIRIIVCVLQEIAISRNHKGPS